MANGNAAHGKAKKRYIDSIKYAQKSLDLFAEADVGILNAV
jgi:hypothetical protein